MNMRLHYRVWLLAFVSSSLLAVFTAHPATAQPMDREYVSPERVQELIRQLPDADDLGKQAILLFFGEVANRPGDILGDSLRLQVVLRGAAPEIAKLAASPNPRLRAEALRTLGQVRAAGDVIRPVWAAALSENRADLDLAISQGLTPYLQRSQLMRDSLGGQGKVALLDATVTDFITIADLLPRLQASSSRQARANVYEGVAGFFDTLDTFTFDGGDAGAATFLNLKRNLPVLAEKLTAFFATAGQRLWDKQVPEILLILNSLEQAIEVAVTREDLAISKTPMRPVGRLLQFDLQPQGREAANRLASEISKLIPALNHTLQSPRVDVRLATCNVYEAMGNEAVPALDAILTAASDPDIFVRWSAARILGKLELNDVESTERVVAKLTGMLADEDLSIRGIAALALEQFGTRAAPAVFALSDLAKRKDAALQIAAVRALGAMGPAAVQGLDGLAAALESQDERVREMVPPILARLGPKALPAAPALKAALNDPSASVRLSAAEALVRIVVPNPGSETIRPAP